MRRFAALLLTALVLLTGCSTGKQPTETEPAKTEAPKTEQPAPTVPEPEPVGDPASLALMPVPEQPAQYGLSDGPQASEWYIRDGERLIGAYNGNPYVTWFILPQGIYRMDPKGTTLLRYLPRDLKDGLAWKQQSGDAEVWFSLHSATRSTPTGPDALQWELTVLNRGERTLFRFLPGGGITWVASENLAKPTESFTKQRLIGGQQPSVSKEQMLAAAATRPAGALPEVTEVSPAEFDRALRAMQAAHGVTVTEIDLDGDGTKERIEAVLDQWSAIPPHLYNSDGNEIEYAFHGQLPPGVQNRLQIVNIPGIKVPTLLYEAAAEPAGFHSIGFKWYTGQGVSEAWGWAPKTTIAWGSDARIEADGRIAIIAPAAKMAGYTWTRWFRLDPSTTPNSAFTATFVGEEMKAGPYPAEPAELLTAAMIAHWYKQKDDFARFVPDAVVRAKIEAAKIDRPMYYPIPAQLGKITYKPNQVGSEDPMIESTPLAADGSTGFMIVNQEYEGGTTWTGQVRFGKAEDGRWIINDFVVEKQSWNY